VKILQLVQKRQPRGAEVFAGQLSRALHSQGHCVHLLYLYAAPGAAQTAPPPTDEDLCGDERHWAETALGVHPGLLRRLLRFIGAFQPDIVQANGARTVKYGALARRLQPHAGWRLVYRNIGSPRDWILTPAHHLFYRWVVMPAVDGIVSVSRTTLAQLLALYRIDPVHTVIGGGIDPGMLAPTAHRYALRQRAGISEDVHLLLFVGSLAAEKRVDRLLRLVARLRRQGLPVHAWIVGDGPLRAALETEAHTLDIDRAVRFWGTQTHVADFYHAADLCMLTSDTEGLPAVLLEAGYAGLPVVATDVGGVAECVVAGETGLLVPPGDDAALEAAVRRLLADPAARPAMGAAAHEHVAAHYLIDHVATRYLDFFRSLLPEE
jgi:glycosyltransferase involved in cell wall biosynthesis